MKLLIHDIGQRITALRTAQNISMIDLAKATGVTRSLISQIEKGSAYPSLQTLDNIVQALGTNLSDFFSNNHNTPDYQKQVVLHAGERKTIKIENSPIIQHLLSPDPSSKIEFTIWEIPPHTREKEMQAFQHQGEEHFFVLEGKAILHLGEQTIPLKPQDSGSFQPEISHYYSNPYDRTAKIITVANYTAYQSKAIIK